MGKNDGGSVATRPMTFVLLKMFPLDETTAQF